MRIRKATGKDVGKILKLGNSVKEFKVSKKTVSFWPKKVLMSIVKSKNNFILLAEEDKKLMGFIIINYNPAFDKAIIENIFVVKEFRQKNIGSKLLKEALKKINCGYVCTLAELNNKKSINFYSKNGFTKGIKSAWLDRPLRSFKLK